MTQSRTRFVRRIFRRINRSRQSIIRVTLIALVAFFCIFGVIRLSAPYLISTSLVRNGMERAISSWTGHRAIIGGSPELEFWPVPRLTLQDVTIEKRDGDARQEIARIDRMSASFSLVKALRGQLQFRDFHFVRPHLFLTRGPSGAIDWTDKGLLARALAEVKPGGGNSQVLERNLNARIGSITIEDGTVELQDAGGAHFQLGGISADIDWPSLQDAVKAYVLLRIFDHDVKMDLASSQPLLLASGRNATASLSFSSPVLTARFDGVANLASTAFLSGAVEINAADIPGLLAWSGAKLPSVALLKSASMSADLMTADSGVRFNNLRFAINDTNASGVLDLTLPQGRRPKMTGTLAFDQLDVRAFLSAFSLNVPAGGTPDETADATFLRQLDVDLRLSAQTAALSPFDLRDVGASVLVAQGKANFDIGDSEFEGGQMIAHMDVAESGFEGGGNLAISIRDADLAAAAARIPLSGSLPLGIGSLDLTLKTDKPVWATSANDISGSVKMYTGTGSLKQFDTTAFRSLAASKTFFQLSEAGSRNFDFDNAEIVADFAKGSATIKTARIIGRNETLTLSGVIPYGTNGMALAGMLKPADGNDTVQPLPFFAGGSWPDPVISPISILTGKPLE
ncbi:MAG: hypothetical protein BGN83_15085 [Rhizobium sp. 63-7]|nr:MAG: hypothetical protein BGN83_15085 [Rhizobium sp. 63-7]